MRPGPRQFRVPDPQPAETVIEATVGPPVPWWLWPQVLSLDAPLVIVLWQAALAHTHRVHLPQAFYWGLLLVTWLVYVLDRTADAMSGRLGQPASGRHAFHFRHRKVILGVVLPLGCLAVIWIALTQMPAGLLWRGLGLAMLGALYLAYFSAGRNTPLYWLLMLVAMLVGLVLITGLPLPPAFKVFMSGALVTVSLFAALGRFDPRWRSLLPKELIAASLIALGCSTGVHFWVPEDHSPICVEVILLSGLFMLNLLGISGSEHLAKLHADPESLLQTRPSLIASHFWFVAAMIAASGWVIYTTIQDRHAPGVVVTAAAVGFAAALLGVLLLDVRRLAPEFYHLLADVALIAPLPALFWLMPG